MRRCISVGVLLALVLATGGHALGQETLTLATPETRTIATAWQIRSLSIDVDAPNIEVTLKSTTTADRFVWRFVVCQPTPEIVCGPETGTLAQVRTAIGLINRGEFKTVSGQTLNQWILSQVVTRKIKVGTVTP